MYPRPRFLEELHAIREEMSRECDYDAELFAEMVRSNQRPHRGPSRNIRGVRLFGPAQPVASGKNGHENRPAHSVRKSRKGESRKGIKGRQD